MKLFFNELSTLLEYSTGREKDTFFHTRVKIFGGLNPSRGFKAVAVLTSEGKYSHVSLRITRGEMSVKADNFEEVVYLATTLDLIIKNKAYYENKCAMIEAQISNPVSLFRFDAALEKQALESRLSYYKDRIAFINAISLWA